MEGKTTDSKAGIFGEELLQGREEKLKQQNRIVYVLMLSTKRTSQKDDKEETKQKTAREVEGGRSNFFGDDAVYNGDSFPEAWWEETDL